MKRRIFNDELHAHYVTFSCYGRRKHLDHDRAKKIVLGIMNCQLSRQKADCLGYVVMPNHVHAVLWFPSPGQSGEFMKLWKQQSSVQLKQFIRSTLKYYAGSFDMDEPIWFARYYDFNIYSTEKLREKLEYIHFNPVKAGLVETPCQWPWSSARFYERGRSTGVPIRYFL